MKRMEDTKGDELAKDIDDILALRSGGNPVEPLVSHDRMRGESLCDVFREVDVAKQQFETWVGSTMIYIMWRLPAEHLLGTLGEDSLEAHRCHLSTNVVVVDKGGVTEHFWTLAKLVLDGVAHVLHLGSKTFLVGKRGKSVAIRLTQELHLSR